MEEKFKKYKVLKKNKTKELISRETLEKLTQEELIEKVLKLETHNLQLKNIIQKRKKGQFLKIQKKCNKKVDFEKISKRHVFLKFYYLGWDCDGFATQEDTNNTIEFFLFEALQKCQLIESRESSNYHRCGRTDKGVSAFSQVVSIDLRSRLSKPNEKNVNKEFPYCTMLNRLLPDNIKCYAWSHVNYNSSARFDCAWRLYKYYFPKGSLNVESVATFCPVWRCQNLYTLAKNLMQDKMYSNFSHGAMQEAAKFLIGSHDFRNLCKMDVGNGVVEFQREIKYIDIGLCAAFSSKYEDYQIYELIIKSKSFLWHQIRCIMSILFLIGQEKESPDIVKHLLNIEENPNKPQYSMANHLPLILYDVNYNDISVNWNYDDRNLCKVIELLQSQWTNFSIRSAMIKDMICDLQKLIPNSSVVEKQAETLIDGVKSKIYKPLLSRMTCESLENKILSCIRKRKLEIADTDKSIF